MRIQAVLAAVFLSAVPTFVHAGYATFEGTDITQGQLRVAKSERGFESEGTDRPGADRIQPVDRFVLEKTTVDASISGVVARVRVEQVFANPYDRRLEAIYVFPLPEDAAVDRYSFETGGQIVVGTVKEKEQARQEYEKARTDGKKAALLEEERANVFSQSVANIPPGERVTVRIEYVHPIKIDHSRHVFRFPLVVAPRYEGRDPAREVGRGWKKNVAAALSPGQRIGNDVFLRVNLDGAMPITHLTPISHELDIERDGDTRAKISLRNAKTIANKDFVFEYQLAGEAPVVAALTHRAESAEEGYLALVVQPKRIVESLAITPREVVLVLDKSGSMRGRPISQLRVMADQILAALNPQDTFRVIAFDSSTSVFDGKALPAVPRNLRPARNWVAKIRSGSGTELLGALRSALSSGRSEAGRPRYLVLLSDALVGNDDRILGYMKRPEVSDVRVFPIALGAAPNHYLIARAAELGRGFSMAVNNEDNAVELAKRFNEKTAQPYLTDIQIDWGGLDVKDMVPEVVPDLYAGQPLVVYARYQKPGSAPVVVRANLAGKKIETELDLELPSGQADHDAVATMWARTKIRQLWNRQLGVESRDLEEQITQLGLEHQLVTRYTSFIAVEAEASGSPTGSGRRQVVPTHTPEGMTLGRGTKAAPAKPQPGPVSGAVVSEPRRSTPRQTPAPSRSDPPRRTRSFGGGGGAVEWVYLLCLGVAGVGGVAGRKRRR